MANTFQFTWTFVDGVNTYHQTYNFVQQPVRPAPVSHLIPQTVREIEAELDIIRGVVPTPKGYNIDKNRAKLLMQRLKELS